MYKHYVFNSKYVLMMMMMVILVRSCLPCGYLIFGYTARGLFSSL
uniref:Uncharacterized protein n=1 Tax=Rhizophora mucronata TaxID=61149 RepID=A0A2P2QLM4_RHIMU